MAARKGRIGKSKYKTINWKDYNNSLRARGDIFVYMSEEAIANWYIDPATIKDKKPGRQRKFHDYAIQACLSLRLIFGKPLRQTEGLINSLFKLMNLSLGSPDYSTLSRRTGDLKILKRNLPRKGPVILLIDSTGLKICGSGEWTYEKHKSGRRKKWRKLHIAVDQETQEIVASILTEHSVGDASQLIPLINKSGQKVKIVKGDGVF